MNYGRVVTPVASHRVCVIIGTVTTREVTNQLPPSLVFISVQPLDHANILDTLE